MNPVEYLEEILVSYRIFNHDILSCTHEGVSGNHLYSGRALGLTDPEDIIQIHPFLKPEWIAINEHYYRIGLPVSGNVIWDISLDRFNDYPECESSVFFYGPTENKYCKDNNRFKVVDYINNKNNFTALATHLDLDVIKTRCFHGKQWFAGINNFTFPCYVKAAVSVAGKGIFRCENKNDVIKALSHFEEDIPLQVQDEINTNIFLNMQYEADDNGIKRFLVSEQILDGYTHKGNKFPACSEPWEAVEPMAEWLWEKGIRGIFAFDVGVVDEGDSQRFIPIECNPRFNGASYPTIIALRLEVYEWVAKEFDTQYKTLDDIDLSGIEFNPETGSGIIIVNWGTILVGKIGVLISGSSKEQKQLEKELCARL